ncbi:hypothetical protein [Arthrobacter sp. NEB 688]|uniref:hypothetical protein n=1 Tax=Arthrobacter sp. NEB 688 TaxID=904039 RepID=UPI00156370AF|nr:hypothetical protein [Arthrobacter sp. NEB 688]QKE85170.1 hypothetical protein HL663_15315 [Arthrobacter sp. NEB 688]
MAQASQVRPGTDREEVDRARSLALGAEAAARSGDPETAVAAWREAWPVLAAAPDDGVGLAACLRTVVLLGNTDRALDLLLPRVDRVEALGDPAERRWLAASAAWTLAHGIRLGMVPARVAHDEVDAARARLEDLAQALCVDDADRRALAAAHDDRAVVGGPTLPPTRLPRPPGGEGGLRAPGSGDEVVAIAARARAWRRTLDPALERLLHGWLETREQALPLLTRPEHWAAASLLDRSSVHLLRDPVRERLRLDEAVATAERGGDDEGAAHARGELAVLDAREAASAGAGSPEAARARRRALEAVEELEAHGRAEAAAASRRWYALSVRPDDAADQLLRSAEAYERLGQPARQALCLLDAAPPTFARDTLAGHRLLDTAERLAAGHPVLVAQVLDLRARVARAAGDLAAADRLYARAAAAPGVPDGARTAVLFAWCDLLVDRADWEGLETRAADALALAVRLRDPLSLAVAQRHLGLAWVEQGRPAEAAELLAAALPVVRRDAPELVGPTAWALGNASLALGAWEPARGAFVVAGDAFEEAGRLEESSHARYRAGTAAWDGGHLDVAATDLDAAVALARRSQTLPVLLEALRSRASVRAESGDVDGGLAALDAVLGDVATLAARLPEERHGEEPFDAEVLEPDVLREGAHVLAGAGRFDEALARLGRAEALVGGDFALVLRAERGVLLAEAGRLDEAEVVLREALDVLGGAGLREEQVEVAAALARALDRAGRVDEAEAVWATWGDDD